MYNLPSGGKYLLYKVNQLLRGGMNLKKISRMSDEKKCVICLALTIIMGLLLFYTYIGDTENHHEGIIRLHVIANSNTADDQNLKLKVRDAVIEYMNKQEDLEDVDETREYLKSNLNRLEKIADGVIASEGYDYAAKANIGIRYIPEKTYGDITFPPGNYEALNITIGEGQGENWWCVLFPPLCLLDEGTVSSDEAEISEMTDDKSADEMAEEQQLTDEERLHLKWKLLELLKEED